MKFVDEAVVAVQAGNGGAGAVSFLREKYMPLGGPDGGDGGRGGSVVIIADENIGTLYDVRFKREIRAENGEKGMGKNMFGRAGEDALVARAGLVQGFAFHQRQLKAERGAALRAFALRPGLAGIRGRL